MNIDNLPIELILYIGQFLDSNQLTSFGFTCKVINNCLYDELDQIRMNCIREIEDNWNYLVPEARRLALLKLPVYKSEVCSGWEVKLNDQFNCSYCSNKIHSIEVIYVYNPRDVDLLAWFLDGNKMGMSMF